MKTKKRSEWMEGLLYAEACTQANIDINVHRSETSEFWRGVSSYSIHYLKKLADKEYVNTML